MTLTQYPPMCRPFAAINTRIEYHLQIGKLLDGMKYDFEGQLEAKGARDLPLLQPTFFADIESIGPGANMGTHPNGIAQGLENASPAWDEQTVSFWLYCRRDYGLMRRDPENQGASECGLMEWVARIRDAVETTEDGKLDRQLGGTIERNIQSMVTQNEVSELIWGALIEFSWQTGIYCSGERYAEHE